MDLAGRWLKFGGFLDKTGALEPFCITGVGGSEALFWVEDEPATGDELDAVCGDVFEGSACDDVGGGS
jgi:hypothetical protein